MVISKAVKQRFGPVAVQPEVKCSPPSAPAADQTGIAAATAQCSGRTVEKDFSQLDPADQAKVKRVSLGYRSSLRSVRAALDMVEAETPYHDHLLDPASILAAVDRLTDAVTDLQNRAVLLPR